MAAIQDLSEGVVLTGAKFAEPMRIVGSPRIQPSFALVDLVGTRSHAFKPGFLITAADLADLTIQQDADAFAGDPRLFKLGLQALRISLAQEYDPFFGLSISRVDPLPHQLDAVYSRVRFPFRSYRQPTANATVPTCVVALSMHVQTHILTRTLMVTRARPQPHSIVNSNELCTMRVSRNRRPSPFAFHS